MTITVYHVSAHQVTTPPGNQQADESAQICLLEEVPAKRVAGWLHRKTGHKGQRTLWAVAKDWGLLLRYATMVQVCQVCPSYSLQRPWAIPRDTGQIARSNQPAQRRQMDSTGPLPLSDGCQHALTSADTATGLLQTYPSKRATQKTTMRGLGTPLCCLQCSHGHQR